MDPYTIPIRSETSVCRINYRNNLVSVKEEPLETLENEVNSVKMEDIENCADHNIDFKNVKIEEIHLSLTDSVKPTSSEWISVAHNSSSESQNTEGKYKVQVQTASEQIKSKIPRDVANRISGDCFSYLNQLRTLFNHLESGLITSDNQVAPRPNNTSVPTVQELLRYYKDHKCTLCPCRYSNSGDLRRHQKLHTGIGLLPCNACNKKFTSYSALCKHRRTHTGEKPHICEICNKGFAEYNTMQVHLRVHTGERPYVCVICHMRLTTSGSLNKHMRVHTRENAYACSECGYKCQHSRALNKHLSSSHGIVSKRGNKPYECDVCPKKYCSEKNLRDHKRLHSGEGIVSCDRCGKRFVCASTLKIHVRTHTGERPHVCTVCGKAFVITAALEKHQRIHTGEKPFKCKTCDRCFASTSALDTHSYIHTGEKPYACTICDYRSTHSYNIKKHLRNVHKVGKIAVKRKDDVSSDNCDSDYSSRSQ